VLLIDSVRNDYNWPRESPDTSLVGVSPKRLKERI
jgi:hypothetical protein